MVVDQDLYEKCRDGEVQQVKEALANGADPNSWGNSTDGGGCFTLLMIAAMNHRVEVVDLLLGAPGINVNALDNDNYTPIMLALLLGSTEVVRVLAPVADLDCKFAGGHSLEER